MDEQDGFRIEAALQFGFKTNGLGDHYTATETALIAFAKACERKGLAEAKQMLRREINNPLNAAAKSPLIAALGAMTRRTTALDIELKPILVAEAVRAMIAAGYVRAPEGHASGAKWIKSEPSEEPTQVSDCEVCGGDCAAANPPVMNCPILDTPVKPAKSFWCTVALDYDKDEAWILDQSNDARDCDLLDGSSGDDNGLMQDWIKTAAPGLYKLYLSPWGHQEWDTGVDVSIVELLVAFPPRLCDEDAKEEQDMAARGYVRSTECPDTWHAQRDSDLCDDEGCPHHGTDHVCVSRADYKCENCIGLPEAGCYCAAVGAVAPGGPLESCPCDPPRRA